VTASIERADYQEAEVNERFSQSTLLAPPEYFELHAQVVQRLGPSRQPLLIGLDGRDGADETLDRRPHILSAPLSAGLFFGDSPLPGTCRAQVPA
jgi:hypothetical protein